MSETTIAVADKKEEEKPAKQLPAIFREISIVHGLPQLHNMEAVYEYSRLACAAGIFTDLKSASQGAMKIIYGLSLGMTAPEALNEVYFAQGRAGLYSQAVARKIKESEKYDYKFIENTEQACELEVFVDGVSVGTEKFKWEQVVAMKLDKKPSYLADPALMLFYKCISRVYKKHCGDIYRLAVNTVEDLQDGETIRIVEEMAVENGGKQKKLTEKVNEKAANKAKERVEKAKPEAEPSDVETVEEAEEVVEEATPTLEEKVEAIKEVAQENGQSELAAAAEQTLEKLAEPPKRNLSSITLAGAKNKWNPFHVKEYIAETWPNAVPSQLDDEQWAALQAHVKANAPKAK